MNQTNHRSFGQLVTETIADLQTLIRQQIDLAVAELKQSAKHALVSSITLIAALLMVSVALLMLVIALAFGIAALGVPTWLAFVIDAGVFLLVAVILLLVARSNAKRVKAPSAAADQLQASVNQITESVTRTDS